MNATMNHLMRTYREELAESVDANAKDNNLFHQDLNQVVASLEDAPEGGKPKGRRKRVVEAAATSSQGNLVR